ncbi:MAG: NADH-quinone oxidoreductase subunit N, partial [Anaerolineales bacterium]|nr:NADH-quinone oxidoreductase subunit N [Anaerolineales bacterium]
MGTITAEMFQAILPEVCLLLLAVIVLAVDLLISDERKGILPWLTALGLVLTLVFSLLFGMPGSEAASEWGGMLRHDLIGFVFKMVFIFGGLIVVLFSMDYEEFGKRGEYYVLMLISLMGMTLMSSAGDLIMLFLSIETTSIPLYVLSGFLTSDDKSTESGIKYLLFGSMTTAIMVYGFSLLYGFSGTTNLYKLAEAFADMPALPLIGSILLILVGFAFKVSMAPFHFWAPDVYEGAPTPITAFLSTASKGAGFAVLLRVLLAAFPGVVADWSFVVSVGAALTMTMGNYIALKQTNIKRLLAYSSIAHAGYMLIGVAAASTLGVTSVVYYI